MRIQKLLLLIVCAILCATITATLPPSKYRGKGAINLDAIAFGADATEFEAYPECHQDVDILWKSKLESSTVGTPILADLFQDGRKQIVVAGINYIDAFFAHDGKRLPGFPFSFGWTSIVADPALYDIDEDGYEDIVVSTLSGEIMFVNRWGEIVPGRTLKIPRARVARDWFIGLEDKSVTTYMSLADVTRYERIFQNGDTGFVGGRKVNASETNNPPVESQTKTYKGVSSKVNPNKKAADRRAREIDNTRTRVGKDAWKGFEGWLTEEGLDSLQLFLQSRPLNEQEELDALFSPQYAHWIQAHPDHHQFPDSDSIFVDAHIYDSPIFADLDGDGVRELIVAVNYYFDDSIVARPLRVAKYPVDTDFKKFVACGVVVFSMLKEQILWISHLELTTDYSDYLARIYASPTVVDLDNDGKLEIIVGTAVGSVYVLNHEGLWNPKLGSITTDSIGSPIVAADITGDGKLNLLVADDGGTVVCFDADGTEIWETRVGANVNHAPQLGDIDGDGNLDVVVLTTVGHIWAFSGRNGKVLPNFPINIGCHTTSAPLLVPLSRYHSKAPWSEWYDGLTIVTQGIDGVIYFVHAKSGCIEKVDIGESSMGMILADDVTANGLIDLVLATNAGHVFCLSTGAPLFSTAASWRSKRDGYNSFTTGVWQGIRVAEQTRQRQQVSGNTFTFSFEIVDKRTKKGPNARYEVTLWHGSQKWYSQTYYTTGVHNVQIRSPSDIMSASLKIQLVNEHGQAFFDTWNVGFNQQWYRTLKWLMALPIIFMSLSLLFIKDVTPFLP